MATTYVVVILLQARVQVCCVQRVPTAPAHVSGQQHTLVHDTAAGQCDAIHSAAGCLAVQACVTSQCGAVMPGDWMSQSGDS